MKWEKIGLVFKAEDISESWRSHCMAPAPVIVDGKFIRIFLGGWDSRGISRIYFIDVDLDDPQKILRIQKHPILDIGKPGMFDDNGVFPGHIFHHKKRYFLYYTGFQLSDKVRYFNFGGAAISEDGKNFARISEAPILDRSDEGLYVRAGQSVIYSDGIYHACYSSGNKWREVEGQQRPIYDVYYQSSTNPLDWSKTGRKIIECDSVMEHGLGRPQIVRLGEWYYVFYTRRIISSMKYHWGYSRSKDCVHWERLDDLSSVPHGRSGFDSEMVYFPAVVVTHEKLLLFYSGNGFGREGMGCAVGTGWEES